MSSVYVLLETENGLERPVGVVTTEKTANQFYAGNAKHRDWIMFNLDELPENIQPIPEASAPESGAISSEAIDATRRRVEETTQNMRSLMEKMRGNRRTNTKETQTV